MKIKVIEKIVIHDVWLNVDDEYEAEDAILSWYVEQGYAEKLEGTEKPEKKTSKKE